LAAADRHIAKLEEKLLKLKKAQRDLKQLKQEKQALRKSPERKIGQVLLAPYRLPQKLIREVRKRWRPRETTYNRSAAAAAYQKWLEHHRTHAAEAAAIRNEARAFVYQPLISIITPVFNTQRMVKEYTEQLYIPAAQAYENFSHDGCSAATHLSQWKTKIRKDWPQVQVSDVQIANKDRQSISVGESLQISARVHLGAVDPQHVRVEAYHGEVDNGDLLNPTANVLNQSSQADGNGDYIYQGSVPATESGTYGFSVRVVPTHPCLMQAHELRLITW
jgi:hypothetical protein